MLGNGGDDPLFLQAKEAQASVLEPFLGKSKHANHGQRVVEGQRLMQSASDVMLGWIRTDGVDGVTRDYYVRQLWDGKGSAVIEAMKPSAPGCLRPALRLDAGPCPRTVRGPGGHRQLPGHRRPASTAPSRPSRRAYADQNERDHAALKQAVDDGQGRRRGRLSSGGVCGSRRRPEPVRERSRREPVGEHADQHGERDDGHDVGPGFLEALESQQGEDHRGQASRPEPADEGHESWGGDTPAARPVTFRG